jgi:hypothetical protein
MRAASKRQATAARRGALDVTPMAIYGHVRDKTHLLDLMADRLLEQLDLAPAKQLTWQEWLCAGWRPACCYCLDPRLVRLSVNSSCVSSRTYNRAAPT